MIGGRFVILADLHLGLFGPQADGRTFGDVAPLTARAAHLVAAERPDHVVILGDAVNRGYDEEYAQAKQMLTPIFDRAVAILGNHELQRASIADFERNSGVRAFRVERLCGLPAIILNSGIENLPDSQWHGELSDPQIRFLDEELAKTPPGPLFVFVHHPIAGTTRNSDAPMFGLTNGQELQSRLERRGGPIVVFSAHTHIASYVKRGSIHYLGAPPAGFWPHAYLLLHVDQAGLRFETKRILDRPQDSPDPDARDSQCRATVEGEPSDQAGFITF